MKFTCTKCGHNFSEVENYNAHVKSHDEDLEAKAEKSIEEGLEEISRKAHEDSGDKDGRASMDHYGEIKTMENLILCVFLESFIKSSCSNADIKDQTKKHVIDDDNNHEANRNAQEESKDEQEDYKNVNRENKSEDKDEENKCDKCLYVARDEAWLETHKRSTHGANTVPNPAYDELI